MHCNASALCAVRETDSCLGFIPGQYATLSFAMLAFPMQRFTFLCNTVPRFSWCTFAMPLFLGCPAQCYISVSIHDCKIENLAGTLCNSYTFDRVQPFEHTRRTEMPTASLLAHCTQARSSKHNKTHHEACLGKSASCN